MMTQKLLSALTAFALLATPAVAEVVPLIADDAVSDGPFLDVVQDASFTDTPTSMQDIVRISDLDGDITVVTAREQEMIALLSAMLMQSPIQN